MTIAIKFENISKTFIMKQSKPRSVQEVLFGYFDRRKQKYDEAEKRFQVLKDISFEIYKGETISLIGSNGAGKSTILKLITRIIRPTHGTIHLNGRISALLELGTGFHPDLTGRENIYLGGTLVGLSRYETNQKFNQIIEFANIGQFIDVPVRHYSSGMFVRLGFALATHVEPDILVVDEALAVGDAPFQKKCLKKIREIREQDATVLLVSHNMGIVHSISDRIIWVKNGVVKVIGKPDDVIQAYLTDQRTVNSHSTTERNNQQGRDKIVSIEKVEFINGEDKLTSILETGKKGTIRIHYLAHERVENPVFGLEIYGRDGVHINRPNTNSSDFTIDYIEGRGAIDYQINHLPLLGGIYSVTVGIFDKTTLVTYDYLDSAFIFNVEQNSVKEMYGLVYISSSWKHSPHTEL